MKNVFVFGAVRRAKYEGNRSVLNKVLDHWNKTEEEVRTQLEHYWDLVGSPHLTIGMLNPVAALANSLREWADSDEEDQRIGVANYLYSLWCVRAVVKCLTEPHWRVVVPQLETHFWYALGEYRGTTAKAAAQQLKIKLELSPLSFSEFCETIE